MPLAPQSLIGRYQIHSLLGSGGMGEVYRARDTRLERSVALKVLSPALGADPEAVRRFEQEARAASALNHQGILTVFDAGADSGRTFLVTELLEGSTLRQRLADGPVAVPLAFDIGMQIAAALGAAHAVGIVHRDIKPENLFVTSRGVVKILDFGIARLSPELGEANRGTTFASTAPGLLLGTAGYMAPEQARGGVVDGRADIFAFGCVFYEMLSGNRAFRKPTSLDTLAAIIHEEPPELPAAAVVPPALVRILKRCLKKDPADRFQSASDVAFALSDARDDFAADRGSATSAKRSVVGAPGWAAILVLAAAAGTWWTWTRRAPESALPSAEVVSVVPASARPVAPAVSPDGKWLAYVGVAQDNPQVYVQFLNGGAPINLTGASDIPVANRTSLGGLDISPDGGSIAVIGRPRAAGLVQLPGIWILPAPLGGAPRRVTDRWASARWSPDGNRFAAVLANPLEGDAIVVADADGQGERTIVPAGGGLHLHHIAWGADGRHVYYARSFEANMVLSEIYRAPVGGGPPEPVVRTTGGALYPTPTPDGRALIYAGRHSGEGLNLWWHPLDGAAPRRLTAGAGDYTEPYISRDGRHLVCLARRLKGQLVQIAVDEGAEPAAAALGVAGSGDSEPSLSRDGNRLFISSERSGGRKIWSVERSSGQAVPLTAGDSFDHRPMVAPDGKSVAFISNRGGKRGLWIVPSDGGTARLLLHADVLDRVSWSPDSRRIVYAAASPDANTAQWIVEAAGGTPVQLAKASGRAPAWSPGGEAIALIRSENDVPVVLLTSPSGAGGEVRWPLQPVGLPNALAWSPDGTRIAMTNLPGRAAAEVWVLTVANGALRKVFQVAAPGEVDGLAWTADGRSIIAGRTEYETEVLLIRGLPGAVR